MNSNFQSGGPAPVSMSAAALRRQLAQLAKVGSHRYQAGDLTSAELIFRQILELDEGNVDAMHVLALICHQLGRAEEAAGLMKGVIAARPDLAQYHYDLAVMLQQAGNVDEAIDHCRLVLINHPDHLDARCCLARLLLDKGDLDGAIEHYQAVVADRLGDAVARNNLGIALRRKDRPVEAREQFEEALRLQPDFVDAHNNLGAALQEEGDFKLAIAHYQAALQHDPGNAVTHQNLANLRKSEGHFDLATVHYGHAVRLGRTASVGDKIDGLRIRQMMQLPAIYQSVEEIQECRRRLEAGLAVLAEAKIDLSDPLKSVGVTNFFLAYHGFADMEIQQRIAAMYRYAYRPEPVAFGNKRGDRIRIGFVSANFCNHTIGKLNLGTVRNLDRRRFSVHVFSIGGHDDRTSRAFKQAADEYLALPKDLATIREGIGLAALDVLLFTDIGMEPMSYFLALSRLAPVQCVTWGHPITTGIDSIDYFISSEDIEARGSERHYTEKLVRLPTMQPFYYRPQIAGHRKERAAFGLPDDRHVYLCPQSLFKFHPTFDDILAGILRRDERGLLVLIEGQDRAWTQLLMARFRKTMPDVVQRVWVMPRVSGSDFMNLIAVSDVMLDTTEFCGGNTSYEALAMGTPVITMPSDLLRGRLTYGIYKKMQVTDCIAVDAGEYIDLAVRLGTDRDYREAIGSKITESRDSLYEDPRTVSELELFFEEALEKVRSVNLDSAVDRFLP